MSERNYWTKLGRRKISRRTLLRSSARAGVGAAGLVLVGCGDDDDAAAPQAVTQTQQQVEQQQQQAEQQAQAQQQQEQQAQQQAAPQDQQQQAQAQQQAQQQAVAAQSIPRGGRVIVGATEDLIGQNGMDPHLALVQSGLWRMIYDPIIATKPDGSIDLDASLAESYELVDQTTLVFSLREGVKFQDDTDFNADAVRFNMERAVDTSIPGGGVYAATYAVIGGIDVADSHTVRFDLTAPNAALLTNLQERGGMIISPTKVETTDIDTLRTQPVGTGPYALSSWLADQSSILNPFADGWQKRADGNQYALLDEFELKVIPDDVVLAASLQTGEVDAIIAPDSQVELLLDDDNLTEVVQPGSLHLSWWVNHALYPADNVDFRRALMYAIDKEALNDVFYGGRADLGDSILSTASWVHKTAPAFPTEFNMDKAQEYMVKSGIPEEDRVVDISPGWAPVVPMLQAVGAGWEPLGVRLITSPSSDLATRPWKNRGQPGDLHFFSHGGHRGEPDTFCQLALTQKGTWNLGAADVSAVEGLVQDAVATYDREERKELYGQIQDLQAENLYSILPTLFTPRFGFSGPGVNGLSWDLNGFEWYKELSREA